MMYRMSLLLLLALTCPLLLRADGCAFGKGFTPQLRETHQLAVIDLTDTAANVSMFIAIDGIPAGKELTYILPFWYRPDGFSMTEETVAQFRTAHVAPAHEKVKRMRRIATRTGSNSLLYSAPMLAAFGLGSVIFGQTLGKSGMGRRSSIGSPALAPYTIAETPHARAELFHIGDTDLQQLIRQSGLPAKYLAPLAKYKTPYFAVMQLKGLSVAEHEQHRLSGNGVRYHFTHLLSDGHYTYPLGTGAAWPQPIPLTEVFLTCPDHLAMEVTAPTVGEKLTWWQLDSRAHSLTEYLNDPKLQIETKKFVGEQDIQSLYPSATSSLLGDATHGLSAYEIAYVNSNPDTDISVRITPRSFPWRLAVANFLARPDLFVWLLYFLSWFITFTWIIRRRWLRAGSDGRLLKHCLETFVGVQVSAPILIIGFSIIIYSCYNVIEYLYNPRQFTDIAWLGIPLLLLLAGTMTVLIVRYARADTQDWRKWLSLSSWFYSSLIFLTMTAVLYGFLYWCETL